MVRPLDAWTLGRLLIGESVNGELQALSDSLRAVAEELAALPLDKRRGPWNDFLAGRSDADEIIEAIAHANPHGPAPGPEEDASADGWPPLRLDEMPRAPAFPVHVFPLPLRAYCQEVAAAMLVPTDFVGVAMLAVAGAAIGQSVNVMVKRGWTEAPLLYMVLVARPGKAKTPVLRTVVRPLAEIDRRLRKESYEARQQWEEAKKAHAKDPDANPPPGPEPPQRRAIVKDITRESLALILRDNPRGVLCDPDEATAWVASFNEYKGKGGSDRQFWLSVWSCAAVSVDRKGGRESTYVPYPFASVVGGLPPAMLGSLAEERGRDDGFMDRILFAYPDDGAFPRQHWTEAELSKAAEEDWSEAIACLHATPMVRDPETELERPSFVTFTEKAKDEWVAWFNAHSGEMDDPDFPDNQAGAWSKLRAHAARFALILSRLRLACNPVDGPGAGQIEVEDVRGATALVSYFKAHLERVHHEASGGIGSVDAKSILDWIKRKRLTTFREADVGADLRRFRENPRALADALKVLELRGAIRPAPTSTRHGPGRIATTTYEVHPALVAAPENPGNTGKASSPTSDRPISGISGNSRRDQDHPEADSREITP